MIESEKVLRNLCWLALLRFIFRTHLRKWNSVDDGRELLVESFSKKSLPFMHFYCVLFSVELPSASLHFLKTSLHLILLFILATVAHTVPNSPDSTGATSLDFTEGIRASLRFIPTS